MLKNFDNTIPSRSIQQYKETTMAMIAMCMPILPGKLDMWKEMMAKVTEEPMRSEFAASREAAGVHERSFLQETPHGNFVILTFEGDNPEASFGEIMANMDPEFAAFAKEVHGLDPDAPPPPCPA